MAHQTIGIIVNGATGRIGSTQHLANALVPITREGGLPARRAIASCRACCWSAATPSASPRSRARTASRNGRTDLDAALADPAFTIFFDAAATQQRVAVLEKAHRRRQAHLFREAGGADRRAGACAPARGRSARAASTARSRTRFSLPGLQKLAAADAERRARPHRRLPARIRLVGVRRQRAAVPAAELELSPRRRRRAYPRYVSALALRHRDDRRPDRAGLFGRMDRRRRSASTRRARRYAVDGRGLRPRLWSSSRAARSARSCRSWATRVRRDDLLTLQVDGTKGSAVAGLHRCHVQSSRRRRRSRISAS